MSSLFWRWSNLWTAPYHLYKTALNRSLLKTEFMWIGNFQEDRKKLRAIKDITIQFIGTYVYTEVIFWRSNFFSTVFKSLDHDRLNSLSGGTLKNQILIPKYVLQVKSVFNFVIATKTQNENKRKIRLNCKLCVDEEICVKYAKKINMKRQSDD